MQHDIVIVGASVTGSAVATLARDRGLSVALVDARSRSELGRPRRHVPVPVWALEESRLPVGEVIRVPARLHLVAGDARATVATPDCVMLEPSALGSSLVERAAASGALVHERARVVGLAAHGDGVALEDGSTIHARFVIDASGPSGAGGAALLGERAAPPTDIASVAHEAHRIVDRRLADAYLDATGIDRGESVAFLAPCGPGSLVVARIDDDARTLSFDAVTFSDGDDHRAPTARAAIRRVARHYSWIGDVVTEEARHVPLGGLRNTLSAGNVALVGGAAGMMRPSLGGECAVGLVSARILVDSLAKDGDLSRYERRVRACFEDVAAVDGLLARRFRMLDEDELATMLRSGAIGEPLVRAVLEQRVSRLATARFSAAATFATVRSGAVAMARALDPEPILTPMLDALRMTPLFARLGGRG